MFVYFSFFLSFFFALNSLLLKLNFYSWWLFFILLSNNFFFFSIATWLGHFISLHLNVHNCWAFKWKMIKLLWRLEWLFLVLISKFLCQILTFGYFLLEWTALSFQTWTITNCFRSTLSIKLHPFLLHLLFSSKLFHTTFCYRISAEFKQIFDVSLPKYE